MGKRDIPQQCSVQFFNKSGKFYKTESISNITKKKNFCTLQDFADITVIFASLECLLGTQRKDQAKQRRVETAKVKK